MKARGSAASFSMRVLSPRIEPPPRADEGSIASTATLWPAWVRKQPKASIKLDLPTPGGPEKPSRMAWPVCGITASSSASAWR